ncbi:MAG: hypothetical protein E7015_00365 [Alphaproteobacteria bacterium]|nr:hypothetical protein [Alphaproteobacteria bacterium]
MLELIRKYANSIVVKVFLTVLAGSFFLFFGFSYIVDRIKGRDYVIKIASTKISPQAFKIEKMKKLEMLQRISPSKIDDSRVMPSIIHQLIWENILDLAAKEYGVIVSDSTMYDYVKNLSMFRTEDGHFSASHLRAFLQKLQVPEAQFLASQKREIKSHILKSLLRYVSVFEELDIFLNAEFEQRSLNVVKIDPKSISITNSPSRDDLEEFYTSHSDKFMAPETRSFKILSFAESELEKDVKVLDSELQDAYDLSDQKDDRSFEDMKSELLAEIKQEKLNSAIEEITRKIEDALVSGNTVEEVAKDNRLRVIEVKNVTSEDTNMIKLPYAKDVLTVAFSTEEKESSSFSESLDHNKKIVQWLVYVDRIVPKHVQTFENIEKQVRSEWIKEQRHIKAVKMADELIESFKTSSKFNAKKVVKTSLFDRKAQIDSKNDYKTLIEKICADVFLMEKNSASYTEVDGMIYVYCVDKIVHNKDLISTKRQDGYAQLISENVEDLYQQWVGYLSKKYEVKINYETLKAVDNNSDLKAIESEIF